MALVADYGSSGEENMSEDEEAIQKPSSSSSNAIKTVINTSTQQTQPFIDSAASSDDEEDDDNTTSSIGQFLPKPKSNKDFPLEEAELESGPIPPNKTYGDEERPPPPPSSFPNLVAKKVKGVVRIAAPSLKDFENDVADDKSKSSKFVQSMIMKGSGLFAILPEPRGGNLLSKEVPMSFLKSKPVPPSSSSVSTSVLPSSSSSPMLPRSLIPDSVKNLGKRPPPSKLDEIRAKYMKQEANVVIVNSGSSRSSSTTPVVIQKSLEKVGDSDDSDDESTPNFFSFDSGTKEIDEETLEKLKLPMPDFSHQLPSSSSTSNNLTRNEDYDDDGQVTEGVSSQAVHQQDFMKYVQKKKGKGGKQEEINFIDVNQDDIKPDSTEWVKHITDDSAVPVRRGKGLGGMQKRKHQITYLAVEAKAREQELQQQWAAGRANRRQTKMKYGF